MRAIHINAKDQTVTEVEVKSLRDLQRLVGGLIEAAPCGTTTETLYVDEEGLLKGLDYSFEYAGYGPYFGSGVVIGASDRQGNNTSLKTPLFDVKRIVRFGGFEKREVEA